MNAGKRSQLLRLIEDFREFFYGTLGYWATEPGNLELNPGSKLLIVNVIGYLELTRKPFANILNA